MPAIIGEGPCGETRCGAAPAPPVIAPCLNGTEAMAGVVAIAAGSLEDRRRVHATSQICRARVRIRLLAGTKSVEPIAGRP